MIRSRHLVLSLLLGGTSSLTAGCLALSFGGKTQTVDHVTAESPETLSRIDRIEARVQALEQQIMPPTLPGSQSVSKK